MNYLPSRHLFCASVALALLVLAALLVGCALNPIPEPPPTPPPPTNTVVLSMTERYAPILAELTVPILPKHELIDKDIAALNFWNAPVGSGPFQFAGRTAGTSITLAANKGFYRGQPLLDRVAFL